jgi:transposase
VLNFPSSTRIYVASEPVDIRKGFDALAGWVEKNGLDVYSSHVFVFLSKRMTHLKALTWSRGGFVILFKRLEADARRA